MASTAPSQFHLFPQLPPEIRCQIWYHALPGPRIHRIGRPGFFNYTRILRIGKLETEVSRQLPLPATSSCWAPPLLLVCREAHDEVLSHMKRLYLPSHEGPCHSSTSPRPQTAHAWESRNGLADKVLAGAQLSAICCKQTLVNPKRDTVYLPGPPAAMLVLDEWLKRKLDFSAVRSLAVDVGFSDRWLTGADEGLTVAEIVRRLGHVQELCLISDYSANFLNHRGVRSDSWQGYENDLFTEMEGDWQGGWRWVVPKQENMIWGLNTATEQKVATAKYRLEEEREDFNQGWEDPEVVIRFVKYVKPIRLESPNPTNTNKNELQQAPLRETTPTSEYKWRASKFAEPPPPPPSPSVWSRFQKYVTRKKDAKPAFALLPKRPQSASIRRFRHAGNERICSVG